MNKKEMFNDFNDWKFSEHIAENHKTGVKLWTCMGPLFFTGYLGTLNLGLIERHFLWKHFCNMQTRKALGYDK